MGHRLRTQISLLAAVLLGAALTSSAARTDDATPTKAIAGAAPDASQMKVGERIGPTNRSGYKRVPFAGSCTDFYPAESQRLVEQGEVTIGYAIAQDGTPRNLTVLKSSGIDRLDFATLACAAAWHLPLITKDGVAVLSPGHQATVRYSLSEPLPPEMLARIAARPKPIWETADPSVTPSLAVGGTHNCSKFYPLSSKLAFQSGEVQVGYDVGADGAVVNVKLLSSSGFADLDNAALSCVSTVWRNLPAMKDGAPIASPGHWAIVNFSVR